MTTSNAPQTQEDAPQTQEAAPQPVPSRIVTAVRTGLAYEVGEMSPISQKLAVEGLRNDRMSMIRCYERDEDFHFELQERIRVTVPEEGAPICSSCSDMDGRACRHIWWVNDQILSTVVPEQARAHFQYQISKDGQAVQRADEQKPWPFHKFLEDRDLGRLARRGGWWKQDPMDPQDTREVEETATHILSTFEPCGVLSKQHGQDNFEMLQQESQALFARYKNEMIKQVKSQPFLLIALGAAVPQASRDLLHLTKIHSRIERIFFDYGYWIAMRTPEDSNLEATSIALHSEIGHLHTFVVSHGPTNMAATMQARIAGILLYTLEQLVQYAGDIQTNAVVTIPQYSGLELQDRSLLHKMIDPRYQNIFVLDVLEELSEEVRYSEIIRARVEKLADRLREGEEPCPAKYIELLEETVGLD